MSFLGIGFIPADVQELRDEVKLFKNRVKELIRANDDLSEELSDRDHDTYRSHREELREAREKLEYAQASYEKSVAKIRQSCDEACEEIRKEEKAKYDKAKDAMEEQIAELRSSIRDLELAADEEAQDVDLAIREEVLNFKTDHLEDVSKLEVKIAKMEGLIEGSKGEGKANDSLVKALEGIIVSLREDLDSMIDHATAVAPKINLEKLGFEVTVPAQARGGEQKKQ